MRYSPLLAELIQALQCLPGVGAKSAQRMAFHLLERDRRGGERLAAGLSEALARIGHCRLCRNFSELELCPVCDSGQRDDTQLCVVETPADVAAIEQSTHYGGKYFVLMGRLSPLDGIGPSELGLDHLDQRLAGGVVRELILATNPTLEGEATSHYIGELAGRYDVRVMRLAQGVPLGGELEYLDSGTLAHAFTQRREL
ncbi:MAG: recombination mediator RecR [Gammaproteobacteria bacterium]|nr:recombination mediator RecR [Gammaproteobacteria bacterium]